jgi:hypothetical protein
MPELAVEAIESAAFLGELFRPELLQEKRCGAFGGLKGADPHIPSH